VSRRLIINADDFGWDDFASEAILDLASRKAITSTTIMVNLVKESHLSELRKQSFISTGLHLNLIDGKPVSIPGEVQSIVDSKGNFFSSSELFKRYLSGKVNKEDIIKETKAQIEYLRLSGIEISHADSHQHLHIYPFIGEDILTAFFQSGITKVRRVNVPDFYDKRRAVIKMFYLFSAPSMHKFKSPVRLLSDFSIARDASDEIVMKSFSKIKEVTEMMIHPASKPRKGSYLNRVAEYNYLKKGNCIRLLKEQNIQLINYNDFQRSDVEPIHRILH
jgi:predicted glycoside hydrolase/deacetylase ChbG (UPF0249 family)